MTECASVFGDIDVSTGVQDVVCICDEVDMELTNKLNPEPLYDDDAGESDYFSISGQSMYWVFYEAFVTKSGVLKFYMAEDNNTDEEYERVCNRESGCNPIYKYYINLDVIAERIGLENIRYIELPYYSWHDIPTDTEVVFESEYHRRCMQAYDKIVWKHTGNLKVWFADADIFFEEEISFSPLFTWDSGYEKRYAHGRQDKNCYMSICHNTGEVLLNAITENSPLSRKSLWAADVSNGKCPMFVVQGCDFPSRLRKPGAVKNLTVDIGDITLMDEVPMLYLSLKDCRDYIENRFGSIKLVGDISSDKIHLYNNKNFLFVYCEDTLYDTGYIVNDVLVGGTGDIDSFNMETNRNLLNLLRNETACTDDGVRKTITNILFG